MTEESNRQIFKNVLLKNNKELQIQKHSVYKNISNFRKNKENFSIGNEIPLSLRSTYKKEIFARFDTFSDEMKIFYTDRFIEYLDFSCEWVADGTFLSAPEDCTQLYVIYAKYLNVFFPAVYILTNDKKEETYLKIFSRIKNLLKNNNPKYFIIDNEKAVYNAFTKSFPNTQIYFCLTHFSNNVTTMIKKHSLSNLLAVDFKFKEFVEMLKSLLFLPKQYLNQEIKKLSIKSNEWKTLSVEFFLTNFLKSYFNTDIEGLYSIKKEYDGYFRLKNKVSITTNAAEGHNSFFNYNLNFKKPSLFVCIKNLIEIQSFVEEKIDSLIKKQNFINKNKTIIKYEKMLEIISAYNSYVNLDCLKALSKLYSWSN
jgi:hypothetical protein